MMDLGPRTRRLLKSTKNSQLLESPYLVVHSAGEHNKRHIMAMTVADSTGKRNHGFLLCGVPGSKRGFEIAEAKLDTVNCSTCTKLASGCHLDRESVLPRR